MRPTSLFQYLAAPLLAGLIIPYAAAKPKGPSRGDMIAFTQDMQILAASHSRIVLSQNATIQPDALVELDPSDLALVTKANKTVQEIHPSRFFVICASDAYDSDDDYGDGWRVYQRCPGLNKILHDLSARVSRRGGKLVVLKEKIAMAPQMQPLGVPRCMPEDPAETSCAAMEHPPSTAISSTLSSSVLTSSSSSSSTSAPAMKTLTLEIVMPETLSETDVVSALEDSLQRSGEA